jgi:Rieske 2Fe-2S family protein
MMKTRTAHGAKTLPGHYFTSPEIFATEMERIFGQRWLCMGRATDIPVPGDYVLRQIGNESVIVLRDQAGDIRAFYNVCRHRGTQLCAEAGTLSQTIQCPYHAWTYGLDGRLLGAPNMQDTADFDRADYALHGVETAVWEGFIFINLAPEPEPFASAFAPVLTKFQPWQVADLVVGQRLEYDVAANWKLICQNYSECYHCPTLHPRLNELTPYRDSINDLEAGGIVGGPMRLARAGSMTMSGRTCAPILGTVSGHDLQLIYYYTIFPNMFLSLHPDYVLVHRLEPQSPGRTRVICEWLFAPQAGTQSDFAPEDAIEFWHMTNQQDWHICELSQRGVQSQAYTPGPYSELESLLAEFDRTYLAALGHDLG